MQRGSEKVLDRPYGSPFSALLRMQVLLALTSCCSGTGCGTAQKHMETVNKMGQRPFVIAFRSYAGSRVALLNAASDLLTASGVITYGGGGSDYECYHGQDGRPDFFAAAAAFKSDLPVEQILGMMAAVEERLGGPQREPAPFMRMDLLWVEGVELVTPELTLPNPLIEQKWWANSVFVEAGEDVMYVSKNEGREKASTFRRIGRAFKRFEAMDDPAVRHFYTTTSGGEGKVTLERKQEGTEYSQSATDDVDALAIAGDLLLFAEMDVVRGRDPGTAKDETDEHAYHRTAGALRNMPRDTVVPLRVSIPPNASIDAKAQAWVDGLSRLLAGQPFSGHRTVIYSVSATRIDGAVIGHTRPDLGPYFHPGDVVISGERLADMPINQNSLSQVKDNRFMTLSTRYHPRPLSNAE